ncbi:MAG: hypothetical protein FAF03_11050 [Epsilonproteobacteria bacterium]|nr:hypothetical protein [Campylobacterota bacterium]
MKFNVLFSLIFLIFLNAKYLDNHSCNECHAKIYEEYQSSFHAKGYFNDTLHRKIADKVSMKKYDCATCHMPMADNLKDLLSGKARPDKFNKMHTDAVSCYFCHTIAYVKKAHTFNINTKARQAKNYKPTLYGRLDNPVKSDKHSSTSNPVYAKKVCMGCHSHKLNENNVTIFRAMQGKEKNKKEQNSIGCIKCHMPEVSGGAEKIDKRTRGQHASHKFLGIHDVEFRKTGVDINISTTDKQLSITLTNKMEHPLIIQPARAKYLKIEIQHKGKVIWKNYAKEPSEDKQGYFAYSFKKNGNTVIIPAHATKGRVYNLEAKEKKTLLYNIPIVKKGDKVTVAFYVQLAKSDCAKVVNLSESNLTQPQLMKEEIFIQN